MRVSYNHFHKAMVTPYLPIPTDFGLIQAAVLAALSSISAILQNQYNIKASHHHIHYIVHTYKTLITI